jgi:NAD(P)-dependent dehydrogenase (short-subunit alcohol dehydrogenase family)
VQPRESSELLRAGLLDGVGVLLARAAAGERERAGEPESARGRSSPGAALRSGCEALGARVIETAMLADGTPHARREGELEAEIDGELARGAIDMLVVDAAEVYATAAHRAVGAAERGALSEASAGGDAAERDALAACLGASWEITRATVGRAFLAREHGGRIVYLAPAADAGEHAEAARAGLENLARTLSIEWARRRITAVAIAPAASTRAGEVAALVAYLASPAGAYFSGCLLDLRGPQPDMPPNSPPVT